MVRPPIERSRGCSRDRRVRAVPRAGVGVTQRVFHGPKWTVATTSFATVVVDFCQEVPQPAEGASDALSRPWKPHRRGSARSSPVHAQSRASWDEARGRCLHSETKSVVSARAKPRRGAPLGKPASHHCTWPRKRVSDAPTWPRGGQEQPSTGEFAPAVGGDGCLAPVRDKAGFLHGLSVHFHAQLLGNGPLVRSI